MSEENIPLYTPLKSEYNLQELFFSSPIILVPEIDFKSYNLAASALFKCIKFSILAFPQNKTQS